MILALQLLAGVGLAALLIAFARWRRSEDLVFGVGLIVAAGYYGLAALWAGATEALPLELAGLAIFGTVGILGTRGWRWLLACGWVAHVGWDVLLHTGGRGGYAPDWYPIVCVGFDLFLAGFIAGMAMRDPDDGATER